MQCKQCNKEFKAKRSTAKYCSDKCRKLAFQPAVVSVLQDGKAVSVPAYKVIPGKTVYGRQAVRYNLQEAWDLRPEPESFCDTPTPLNRGRYIRLDGSEYQIDATGVIHNA